jgi:hypothetical protein
MVYQATDDLARALQGNHEMVTRVDVFDADGMRATDVPIIGGQITATLLSDVSRSGSITVARNLIDQGLFNPLWDKVRISTGVRGYPLVPIFTGRVQNNQIDHSERSVTVIVEDSGSDLVGAPFEKPWVVTAGRSVLNEMVNIIHDVDRDFTVDRTTTIDGLTPDVAWNDNRASALDDLATGINAVWQATRSGGFTIFPNPYQQITPPPAVMTLSDGRGGSLTSLQEVRSRDEVYNSITLEVQRADGGDPVRVTVRDNRSQSDTRWGGKFGKRNRRITVSTPYSEGEARQVARRILGQSLALARSWRLTTPHFPLLDPGDVIAVRYESRIWAQVIESIVYPLLAMAETQVSTRELILFNDNVEDQATGFFPGFVDPIDPVPQEPVTMLLGMEGTNGAVTQQIVAEYAPQYMRNFGSDGPDGDTLPELGNKFTGKWFDAPNVIMHTSWKDDVSELATWLDDLDRDIYISWYHEPHGDIAPATFVANCEAMVAIIDAHPNKARILGNGPIVTRYHLDEGGGDPTTWGYDGMTFYGVDCYSQDPNTYWTPQQMFVPAFSKIRAAYPGLPLMVPEYGIIRINSDTTGNGRAAAIKSHIRWLRTQPDVLAVAYFNSPGSIPGAVFGVNTPEGQAWKELMAEQ